ncbi:MAG: hypothetical protein A2751_01460 [Candidatus Doudnabacteria bacterium RIFCSPHIGHO2_01_FULL_46_14]|uniref:Uncharacterized protein n=1 Tax=Candidatus Doudnabacteria bacterium RIFCSPHIGHO2_01_FULL_46_14 TaxID=1817824 RepID=A0A1F5NMU6_9BACT|nr:MAG: hypothetical protein A2751_01460 [Candidatus Doudnabacteria bacterium RIFCSPHIGHO2_01_FULL_46_14]
MTNISTLFPEPGTELVFVRTLPRPRFCVAEGDNIKFDTAVGLHVNEFVYIDGTPFRNLGHAFREEHGNRQIPHVELNSHRVWIPDEVVEFQERQWNASPANCT